MPYSMNVFDAEFLAFIKGLEPVPKRFLDIGPGAGKYGAIIKRQFSSAAFAACIEISPAYVEQFELANLYDQVLVTDAEQLPTNGLSTIYDVAILGDVIEHMRKSAGIDLINYLLYRARWLWVVYPNYYLQYSSLVPSENHRSVWCYDDFPNEFVVQHKVSQHKHLVILRGIAMMPGAFISEDAKILLEG